MVHHLEVTYKEGLSDAEAEGILSGIRDLGIESVSEVRVVRVFVIDGEYTKKELRWIGRELLADAVVEKFALDASVLDEKVYNLVQVARRAGVMDPVALTIEKALKEVGLGARRVRTAKKFLLKGRISEKELREIVRRILANDVIDEVHFGRKKLALAKEPPPYQFRLTTVPLKGKRDSELLKISREGMLSLSLEEMRAIAAYFKKEGREPTDCELETLAQTWSEHCVHKTMRGKILYKEGRKSRMIDNLLKNTIMRATEELKKEWCVLVFKDNAGIIEFDEKYNLCFKVETHNHPSAIEPYGGAATGIGGVIRDPLGTGLGAEPIANTDVFCFAPPDTSYSELPPGCLHPKRVMKGVVAGVRDYGNRMGIPTVNGAVLFDPLYIGNPLVYCGTLGLLPKEKSFKRPKVGDRIVLVGGRTGRDGIHGVTFASLQLSEESEKISSGAVQIGNAITEKAFLDVLIKARDEGLYNAITDCGGGGLSSAVGEMGAELGVKVNLERVPLKYSGLSYTEIWISEAQERMILSVPQEKTERLFELFRSEDVEATDIGEFTGDGRLRLYYEGNEVANLDMEFLHKGLPRVLRKAVFKRSQLKEPKIPRKSQYTGVLLALLSSYNIASKEWVVRQYDHEVQARTVVKPLVGALRDAPSDAAVILPVLGRRKGVALSCGICPQYGKIDPYWMAAAAIDEAIRNAVAVGADPERISLLDNFCWGRTDDAEVLGALVRACDACYDYAKAFGAPFISGKDSLNNEFVAGKVRIKIPHTLLISALGIVEDVTKTVTSDFKEAENPIYLVGLTKEELGGSEYYRLYGALGKNVPRVQPDIALKTYKALHKAITSGFVFACHDCSEGGLAVALAEMAFGGGIGAEISLKDVPYEGKRKRDDFILFSESCSRLIVEVAQDARQEFEKLLDGIPFGLLGKTVREPVVRIRGIMGNVVVEEVLENLRNAWKRPLANL
ncbi:MAG: phosphoribosylformylglycinamidine synthase subunit PurL [Planctomycetota bacterium]|nr:phosphoribosylformylglycinamidine synthase subunit PurL [Planctomycetota bacterium]